MIWLKSALIFNTNTFKLILAAAGYWIINTEHRNRCAQPLKYLYATYVSISIAKSAYHIT